MHMPSCIKTTESETEKKIALLQQNLSGLHMRERESERERERERVCVCVFVFSEDSQMRQRRNLLALVKEDCTLGLTGCWIS